MSGVTEDVLLLSTLKRLVVGRPIATYQADHHRFGLFGGLAVLSSDALSSVAYATEEVLRVLMIGGLAALSARPADRAADRDAAARSSSSRTARRSHAYPGGGGAYIVARDNLGPTAGLAAAAALLIDYTLTVAVSIAAGVSAITSAFPSLHVSRVVLSLAFIAILMIGQPARPAGVGASCSACRSTRSSA